MSFLSGFFHDNVKKARYIGISTDLRIIYITICRSTSSYICRSHRQHTADLHHLTSHSTLPHICWSAPSHICRPRSDLHPHWQIYIISHLQIYISSLADLNLHVCRSLLSLTACLHSRSSFFLSKAEIELRFNFITL